jgi:hypothetical protein
MRPSSLDPAELIAFVRRDWGLLDGLDRKARAGLPAADKSRIAAALYASAKATCPGWPTDADRMADLEHHFHMRSVWDRTGSVRR